MEFSSRMKDYYDIYYLACNFEFDGEILTKALNSTFQNRKHAFKYEQFITILNYSKNHNMLKKWNAFKNKININVDFVEILNTINTFLNEPINFALEDKTFNKQWNCKEKIWK